MDPKSLPHIFDRFYQSLLNEYNASKEGMGIGLSLVKELVDLHEGVVRVRSNVGEGSIFYDRVTHHDRSSSAKRNFDSIEL